jgi:two-component system chemotaxis response regulator CheY
MLKCLIVDDEVVCRKSIAQLLIPYGDCRICSDGYQAIEALSEAIDAGHPYDVVFLDIKMPGMDGHETLTAIREVEESRGIVGSDGVRVIMSTSLADSKHCIQAFREGCEAYLVKPFGETQLLEGLRQVGLEAAATE